MKAKVKSSLYLTKYNAMKIYPLFNLAPRHEDVSWEWRYSSTRYPRHQMEVSGQLHAPAALLSGKRAPGCASEPVWTHVTVS
jgi:hypothetical protein